MLILNEHIFSSFYIFIYTGHVQKPGKTLAQNLNMFKFYNYYILATSKL